VQCLPAQPLPASVLLLPAEEALCTFMAVRQAQYQRGGMSGELLGLVPLWRGEESEGGETYGGAAAARRSSLEDLPGAL